MQTETDTETSYIFQQNENKIKNNEAINVLKKKTIFVCKNYLILVQNIITLQKVKKYKQIYSKKKRNFKIKMYAPSAK